MNTAEKHARFDAVDRAIAAQAPHLQGRPDRVSILATLLPNDDIVPVRLIGYDEDDIVPSRIIAEWWQDFTAWVDTSDVAEPWLPVVKRWAFVTRRASIALDDAGWARAEARVNLALLADVRAAVGEPRVLALLATTATLWQRVLKGDTFPVEEWDLAFEDVDDLNQTLNAEFEKHIETFQIARRIPFAPLQQAFQVGHAMIFTSLIRAAAMRSTKTLLGAAMGVRQAAQGEHDAVWTNLTHQCLDALEAEIPLQLLDSFR